MFFNLFCLLLLSFLVSVCFFSFVFLVYILIVHLITSVSVYTRTHTSVTYSGTPNLYMSPYFSFLLAPVTPFGILPFALRSLDLGALFCCSNPQKTSSDTFIAVLLQLFLLFSEPYRPTWTRQSSSPLCSSKSRLQASLSHFLPPLGHL